MNARPQPETNVSSLPPFPEGWFFIATRDAVRKAGLMQRTWMGEEIVIWSDPAGQICVAKSVCPHLGSELGPEAGARVVGGRLVCPFHGFEFETSGQCVATPSGAPARSAKLDLVEVREIEGLIFGWWGLGGRPSQWHLPDVPQTEDDWTDLQIRTIRFAGHPQETSENSVDIAHLSCIHGYHNVTNDAPVSVDGPQLESRFSFSTTRKIAKFAKLTLDVSAIAHVVGLGYSFVEFQEHSIGLDARLWVLAAPVDGTLIDMSIVSRMRTLHEPKRPIIGLSFLPTRIRAPIVNKFIADLQIGEVKQDVVIWSHKHYVPRPRLVHTDGEIMKFREYCAQFYADERRCESSRP
ncbi:Rieske 2Fe-2S domain-containing protein [Candidatus Poriferisodalis sp.]|uniref:Rieske 2Fe-2S domain-containing protein n=1 Tax=Candidatus Poriferisodalis sp. TaxID=3101277 RepID=UPI003B0199F3